jgi:peptide chain release factor 1
MSSASGGTTLSGNSVVVEIRPGSGGDEAKDFVRILSRMYQRFAARSGWKISALDEGNSMTTFMLEGKGLDRLGTETGVHCIQRIPPNRRKSGKVHTTTATVAVIVSPPELASQYDATFQECKVETMRGTGKGGQNRNKVESAVRITHIPTGLSAICRDERSQAANKERAYKVLIARIYAHWAEKAQDSRAAQLRGQVGGAMRAERFRTYDVPEDRMIDRRSGKRVQNLNRIFDGYLEPIL